MERRWHGTEVAHGKALGGLPKGGGVPAGAAFFPTALSFKIKEML